VYASHQLLYHPCAHIPSGEYYILQRILVTGLHTTDAECQTYAVQLMDKLEQTKSENPTNDAILDDVAAKAYVENFALETFNRGDGSQRQNRVTRQTADTFRAAFTFFDLLGIWGEVDAEIKAKSRFAKYHAVRIAKAIKNGEDPNATNPVIEEPKAPEPGEEDIEAELRHLERETDAGVASGGGAGMYRPPTVENAPESMQPSGDDGMAPPPLPMNSIPPPPEPDVSPIEPTDARQASIGGYFPSLPETPTAPTADVEMTTPDQPATFGPPSAASQTAVESQPSPTDYYNTALPPSSLGIPSSPDRPHRPPPEQMNPQPPLAAFTPPIQTPVAAFAPPPPPIALSAALNQPPPAGGYRTDDESVLAAQKHAKWAISALNFEDVNTAVKELRVALRSLGAS